MMETPFSLLTKDECKVLSLIADAYIAFCQLPEYHSMDGGEFVDSVHRLQNIVMSRVAVRSHPELFHRTTGDEEQ